MDPNQAQDPKQNAANPAPQANATGGQNPYNLVGDAATPATDNTQAAPAAPAPAPQATPAPAPAPAPAAAPAPGGFMKGLMKMIAKLTGQPDPFTGAQNAQVKPDAVPAPGTEVQQPAPATGLKGQIGGVFSGIAQTAQMMAGEAVAGVKDVANQAIPTVPAAAQPAPEAKPVAETPAPEAKVEAKPATETPAPEAKAETKPAAETPAPEAKAEAKPAAETPAPEAKAEAKPAPTTKA